MANTKKDFVVLQSSKLDINYIIERVVSPSCGAVSTFIGTTRDNFNDKKVLKLEYEAYEPMAIKEINTLCHKVRSHWDVEKIAIYHRLGEVPVTEASVVIAISSVHRQESLKAVQFAIDSIKASVPIWKKEIYENDESKWKENKECFWVASDTKLNKIKEEVEHDNFLNDGNINTGLNGLEIDIDNICETIEVKSQFENQNNDSLNQSNEDNKVGFVIDTDQIQIKADAEELNRRIESFISRKREQVNMLNIQEFCTNSGEIQEDDEDKSCVCARVNTMLTRHKDSKSHIKIHRVYNQWKHQNISQTPLNELNSYPEALEERLSTTEKLLGMNKPVPQNIYERIKKMEDRLLLLESISPEYKDFWAIDDCDSVKSFDDKMDINFDMNKPIRKRTYSSAELDSKLHELEDRYGKKVK